MRFTIVMRLFLSSFLAALTVGSVTYQEEPFSTYTVVILDGEELPISICLSSPIAPPHPKLLAYLHMFCSIHAYAYWYHKLYRLTFAYLV